MTSIAKLVAAMQRMQTSYRKLARDSDMARGPAPYSEEAVTQRAIADILGDLIRMAAEMAIADAQTERATRFIIGDGWECIGCNSVYTSAVPQHTDKDNGNTGPFCYRCLFLPKAGK